MSPTLAVGLLVVEGLLLYFGQRQIFGMVWQVTGSKWLAYFFAAPGTVLHEASHYLMCHALGVPVASLTEVSWFRPRQEADGSVTLGSVPHAKTDPFRGTLVAIAPLILVPALLAGLFAILLGPEVFQDPLSAISDAELWRVALAVYIAISAGQAAFPSVGDEIGPFGLLLVAAAFAGALTLTGPEARAEIAETAALVFAVPALTAGLSLVLLRR